MGVFYLQIGVIREFNMHTYHVTPLLEGYEKTKQMVHFKTFGDDSIQHDPYGITVVNAFVFEL